MTETGDFIVCQGSRVYHLHDAPHAEWSNGRSLCGHVDSYPAGGRYRSGRRKPYRTDMLPANRHVCAICAAAADRADAGQSTTARVVALLREHAETLSRKRLETAVAYAPRRLARDIARLELERRDAADREALIEWRMFDIRMARADAGGAW